jgi:P pilus assembly chaperone PapD
MEPIMRLRSLLLLAIPAALAAQGAALGDLLVAPTHLVLDTKHRVGELILSNRGTTGGTFRVSTFVYQMNEQGALVPAPEAAAGAIDLPGLLRFAPRQVTLGPGESQILRVQYRRPADIPDGEYRVHLVFKALPPTDKDTPGGAKAPDAKGVHFSLQPVLSLAVPVSIMEGSTSVQSSLDTLSITTTEAGPRLRLRLNRKGNAAAYGDFHVKFVPKSGKSEEAGLLLGVAAYPNLASRWVEIPLHAPKDGGLAHGRLDVAFTEADGEQVQARATLDLP